jgi:hypothetical protein
MAHHHCCSTATLGKRNGAAATILTRLGDLSPEMEVGGEG